MQSRNSFDLFLGGGREAGGITAHGWNFFGLKFYRFPHFNWMIGNKRMEKWIRCSNALNASVHFDCNYYMNEFSHLFGVLKQWIPTNESINARDFRNWFEYIRWSQNGSFSLTLAWLKCSMQWVDWTYEQIDSKSEWERSTYWILNIQLNRAWLPKFGLFFSIAPEKEKKNGLIEMGGCE